MNYYSALKSIENSAMNKKCKGLLIAMLKTVNKDLLLLANVNNLGLVLISTL